MILLFIASDKSQTILFVCMDGNNAKGFSFWCVQYSVGDENFIIILVYVFLFSVINLWFVNLLFPSIESVKILCVFYVELSDRLNLWTKN